MHLLGFACLVLVMSGCSTMSHYKQQTSGQTGCPVEQIEMTEPQKAVSKTWTAKCNNRTYYCSSTSGFSIGSAEQISCKEAN